MKIALVAACDRYNYGDILMPIVFEKYLSTRHPDLNCEYRCYSLLYGDMTDIGGNKAYPLYTISDSIDMVIFVGGEIMSTSFFSMHKFSLTNKLQYEVERILRKVVVTRGLLEKYLQKKIFKSKYSKPWIYTPINSHQRVIYNCVGGIDFSGLNEKDKAEWYNAIDKASLFSVRDITTFNAINHHAKIKLVPDTVILLDDVFTNELLTKRSTKAIKLVPNDKSYFVIQVNRTIGMKHIELITGMIDEIYELKRIKCVLLPIGISNGHDDNVPLRKVHKLSPTHTILIENNNIYDTASIISKAVCYIGSSLHGAITAMSYGVPHAALTNDSKKLINYLKTWNTSHRISVNNQEEALAFLENSMIVPDEMINVQRIKKMKQRVRQEFEDIYELIRLCIDS